MGLFIRNFAITFVVFFLYGCHHRSYVKVYKAKRNSSIFIANDSLLSGGIDSYYSILGQSVDLPSLIRQPNGQGHSYSVTLINKRLNTIVEATYLKTENDSVHLDVKAKALTKENQFHFTFKYAERDLVFESLRNNGYNSYNVFFKGAEKSEQEMTFRLSKSRNFVIKEGVLYLLTGEIVTPDNMTCQFIVVNDPADEGDVLETISILSYIDMSIYEKTCRDKAEEKCTSTDPNVFSADVKYKYSFPKFFIYKDVVCDIKCKNK